MQVGVNKVITIVQTGITVQVVQPWIARDAAWAPWLNVAVTLTALPANLADLSGTLGGTLPTQTSTVYTTLGATTAYARAVAAARARAAVAARRRNRAGAAKVMMARPRPQRG